MENRQVSKKQASLKDGCERIPEKLLWVTENNPYLTVFESLPNPVIILDEQNRVENMNPSAAVLFKEAGIPGSGYGKKGDKKSIEALFPGIAGELRTFPRLGTQTYSFEKQLTVAGVEKVFRVRFSRMLDVSGAFQGSLVILDDITGTRQTEEALRKTTMDLKKNVRVLQHANRQILDQQKAVIEEERLKVLLQIAGATAHELNQPLMALLGNIELMEWEKNDPEKVLRRIGKVEDAGQRIASIVKKIQSIRHYDVKAYAGDSEIVDLNQGIKILSVDDSEADFGRLKNLLTGQKNIELFHARDMDEAFSFLKKTPVDLIFLDYLLPSGNGLHFLIKMQEKNVDTPVIFITGQGDEMIASQAISYGAYDYLPKANTNSQSLQRAITNAMEKFRLKKEVKLTMDRMAELSTRDGLTTLYNRRYFMEVIERETASAQRYETELVLCMMDLDNFKLINDTLGHPAGDVVLQQVARLLKECVRKSDVPCRYGGDEFAVILPNTKIDKAKTFCERFRKEVEQLIVPYEGSKLKITISIGLTQFSKPSDRSHDDFLKRADQALYRAKKNGRNRVEAL